MQCTEAVVRTAGVCNCDQFTYYYYYYCYYYCYYYYYYHYRFMALCPDHPGEPVPEGLTILGFIEAATMGWQWHKLDDMQVIYTSL